MNLVFAGTPPFATSPPLAALHDHGHTIAAVLAAAAPSDRGMKVRSPRPWRKRRKARHPRAGAIHAQGPGHSGRAHGSACRGVCRLRTACCLPQTVLDIPRKGCLNIHGSPVATLARRAAPVQRAIEAGDKTGICIMQMEAGLDTGRCCSKNVLPSYPMRLQPPYSKKLTVLGTIAIVSLDPNRPNCNLCPTHQPGRDVPQKILAGRSAHRLDANQPPSLNGSSGIRSLSGVDNARRR